MAKRNLASTPSPETQQEALALAKSIQQPGQTKEQTKLVAKGIEKGIQLYKKQQKVKAREADKARKQAQKAKAQEVTNQPEQGTSEEKTTPSALPWVLLALSWMGFLVYFGLTI